jgi:hypothetical protein
MRKVEDLAEVTARAALSMMSFDTGHLMRPSVCKFPRDDID